MRDANIDVDDEGRDSFPASDPPSSWAGPPDEGEEDSSEEQDVMDDPDVGEDEPDEEPSPQPGAAAA